MTMAESDTTMQTDTVRRLESVDHALFEQLALAVVASANPAYDAVHHHAT